MARAAAALGIKAHSGWATVVAVSGPPSHPALVMRERIELSRRTPRQPFHAAEGRPFAAAEALIRRATGEASPLAEEALRSAVARLERNACAPRAAGLIVGAGRPLPDLRRILASHALIHAAEGELFRDVLRQGAARCGLTVVEVPERAMDERAAAALGRPPAELAASLAAWGKALGPPWRQEEKAAALAAWIALASCGAPVP